jgi:lipoprotein-anchoring transpeptidase ErfK/SrfK
LPNHAEAVSKGHPALNAAFHFFKGLFFMRRMALLAAVVLAGTAGSSLASQTVLDPLTGRVIDVTPSNAGGGRAAATPIPRETVAYSGPHRPGTIVVNAKERRLYLVLDGGKALRYGVGVGRPGFEWGGTKTVTRKQEWPTWTPPAQMLKRRPDLPRFMPGGPENPMGARAMYLGSSLYRIHGSNEPETIGQAVSSGCIRMLNDDVIDLYTRVKVGTQVVVVR